MENNLIPTVLKIQIPVTPGYASKYVTLQSTAIELDLVLSDGEHTIKSNLIDVGQVAFFKDPVLQAQIRLWYHYDKEYHTLTFCSSDLLSADSISLTTVPRGSTQSYTQHTHHGHMVPREIHPGWNYRTPLTPGLEDALRQTLRDANNLIIEKAKALGFNVIERTPMPVIDADLYEKLSSVYYKGEFVEFYNPEKIYDADYTIQTIDSVWYGITTLAYGENFANVIGSTKDPKVGGDSWIGLWKSQFGVPNICTSYNYGGSVGFVCGAGLVGGHSILGKKALDVKWGSNKVFIIPICYAHNNNDNVYMAALKYNQAIALHNYMGR